MRRSLEVTQKIMGEGTREVALVLNAIGLAYAQKPNYVKALEYYTQAYDALKEIQEKDMPTYLEMSRFLEDIGALHAAQKNKTKALSYYYQGLLMRKDVYGEHSSEVGFAYERIGDVDLEFGDANSALEAYRSALEVYEKNESKDYLGCIRLLDQLAKLTVVQGDAESEGAKEKEYFSKAMDYFGKCLQLQERYLNEESELEMEWKRSILADIADLYFARADYDEALDYMKRELRLLEKAYKNPTEEVSDVLQNIATIHYKKGDQASALETIKRVYEIRVGLFGKNDGSVAQSIGVMIKIYKGLKESEKAEEWENTLRETLKNVRVSDEEMRTGLIKLDGKRKRTFGK